MVEPFKGEAKFWYQIWLAAGKPPDGDLFWKMRLSRSNFKQAKKKCVNAQEQIKRDRFTEACMSGDKDMFEELKKMKGNSSSWATKVDGKETPEDIADLFGATYNELYNRTGTDQPMKILLEEVNAKINEDDLIDVDRVDSDLIQKILKEKVKPSKSDPEFEITTDALKNGPPELNEHIAAMIRACLIHGYISVILLSCSIIPLVKDKNGKLDSADKRT